MWCIVTAESIDWIDQRGRMKHYTRGDEIDVLSIADMHALAGKVQPKDTFKAHRTGAKINCAGALETAKRVGIWMKTTPYYSGGRVLVYQYAHALASSGAQVFIFTNRTPSWAEDYPQTELITVLIRGVDIPPDDIDLIVTDGKSDEARLAFEYKRAHPSIPLALWIFETPAWMREFCPDVADMMPDISDAYRHADMIIADSDECARWVKKEVDLPVEVVIPAVNTSKLPPATPPVDRRGKYVVWCGRGQNYKGGSTAIKAMDRITDEIDVVIVGQQPKNMPTGGKRRIVVHAGVTDTDKFQLMRNAQAVIAPSLFEGYGMVPAEALACGTPCVVYDLPVLRQNYGDDLVYAKYGDVNDLTEKIGAVLEWKHPVSPETVARYRKDRSLAAMRLELDKLPYHCVDKPYVSAHLISYWGFYPESVESIYPYVDEIIIAYGPTQLVKDAGVMPDGSLELIESLPDPDNKIKLEARDVWADKLAMRAYCASQFRGNRHLLLDGDEIWVGVEDWLLADQPYGSPRWCHLWHDADHYVVNPPGRDCIRWGYPVEPYGSIAPHYRWSRWRSSFRYLTHTIVADVNGKRIGKVDQVESSSLAVPGAMIYHLGAALTAQTMADKHMFYQKRDGDDAGRRARAAAWRNWTGSLGDCGDGIVKAVDWDLPELVRKAVARGR